MNLSLNSTFFNQQELEELESAYGSGGLEAVAPLIQEKFHNLKSAELHIAVTGEAGVGKSTFINAIRGLRGSDEGAAETGNMETTMEPIQYKHPSFPELCFWDLPGVGTLKFPVEDYLCKMNFEKYDFFIIISRGRFTENDANLAKEIKRLNKNFYFVRSQIDNDLHALEMEDRLADKETELIKIKNYCVEGLNLAGVSPSTVMLISSFQVRDFDFPALKETFLNNLDDIKKDVFLRTLPNTTLKILEQKTDHLKKRIWIFATVSGTVGAVPIPGLSFACDVGILVKAIKEFREYLRLDDASLQRLADTTGKPIEVLKAEVKTPLIGEVNEDLVKRMLLGSAAAGISAAEVAVDAIPVIGCIFGAGSSFVATYKLLNDVLNDLVENARKVVKAAFKID
ncbi:interferon-inducible GTPase 5-like [Pristis pectinata]|uniref:interferon-inducible GTPase 5-like n=1 Tax=Pristis pectinata TaxID=685728 RepID=UPI00223E3B44|nr:interferon-inducible GTPase 5-like [Pristis pectinata]